jgi:hypothetical protein
MRPPGGQAKHASVRWGVNITQSRALVRSLRKTQQPLVGWVIPQSKTSPPRPSQKKLDWWSARSLNVQLHYLTTAQQQRF